MRTIRALTLTSVFDPDKAPIWIYSVQHYSEAWDSKNKQLRLHIHRVPLFLSLHAHVTIENVITDVWNMFFFRFDLRWFSFPYHLVLGLTSSHNMREILTFFKAREGQLTSFSDSAQNRKRK